MSAVGDGLRMRTAIVHLTRRATSPELVLHNLRFGRLTRGMPLRAFQSVLTPARLIALDDP